MSKQLALLGLALMFLPFGWQQSQNDDAELSVSIQRDFGFRAGDRIQGRFTLEAFGPADLAQVEFLLDGQVMGVASQVPFRLSFSTSEYQVGQHTLQAVGLTAQGETLRSPARAFEFVTAEQALDSAAGVAIPLVIGVAALATLGAVVPSLLGRSKPFRVGAYGPAGAAVCPRCELPYSRRIFSLNLIGRKLERCPHCRKWALVPRATPAALAAAEARYTAGESSPLAEGESEAERLRRMIDDSRYVD